MDYQQYKKDLIKKWLDENSKKTQLLSNYIIPFKPDLGFWLKVNDIEIPEEIFKEEFETIRESYFNVLHKLNEHYKKTIQ